MTRSIVLVSSFASRVVVGITASLLSLWACGGGSHRAASPASSTREGDDSGAVSSGGSGADAEPAPPPGSPKPPPGKSLYERLGGEHAIAAVVDEFVTRTTADPRIKERFFNTDPANLRRLLVEFVCAATGGPCTYTGRDMATSHAGMDLVDDEFTALVEDLAAALDKFQVSSREKGELLGALGPLKPQIVVAPDKLKPVDDAQLAPAEQLAAALKDRAAAELVSLAVVAARRGQRSYAEQLFTRAEMKTGARPLARIAGVFRAGAPPRVTTALKTLPASTAPQPAAVGGSEVDRPEPRPAAASLHGVLKIDGKPPSGLGVVMLWPESGPANKRLPKQRIVEQRNKAFAPHVMAVPVGSTVSFPNFDRIYHNVFSLSRAKPFDLGMYKSGETREIKFDKPGIVRLGCNLHANMTAYLVVVDAPHYVIAEPGGSYAFKSLPPGKYRVQAWSEQSSEPATKSLTIKPGANEDDLDLQGGAPAVSPDKFGTARQ